jgi:uncharacterized protein
MSDYRGWPQKGIHALNIAIVPPPTLPAFPLWLISNLPLPKRLRAGGSRQRKQLGTRCQQSILYYHSRSHRKARPDGLQQRNPEICSRAYTEDSIWRNRDQFFQGREAIIRFLTTKWKRELDYRLRKELFAFSNDRIAVQFWYEYRDAAEAARGNEVWKRTYGLEHWTFAPDGRMRKRMMSANDVELGDGRPGGPRWFAGELTDGETVDQLVQRADISEQHW